MVLSGERPPITLQRGCLLQASEPAAQVQDQSGQGEMVGCKVRPSYSGPGEFSIQHHKWVEAVHSGAKSPTIEVVIKKNKHDHIGAGSCSTGFLRGRGQQSNQVCISGV
jgi:hypothetical protein